MPDLAKASRLFHDASVARVAGRTHVADSLRRQAMSHVGDDFASWSKLEDIIHNLQESLSNLGPENSQNRERMNSLREQIKSAQLMQTRVAAK